MKTGRTYKKLKTLRPYRVSTRKTKHNTHSRKMATPASNQMYLAIDIETGGIDKPIFALGAAVFSIEGTEPKFFEEGMWNFRVPTTFDSDYYDEDTWKHFWGKSPNLEVLQAMNATPNCANEVEVIRNFYTWWVEITNKYENIKIVTDEPTFDVGYTDQKIRQYLPSGLPLRINPKGGYTSTIDYNTFENLVDLTFPLEPGTWTNPKLVEIWGPGVAAYKHDHNPLNDSKDMAYKFAKVFTFMQSLLKIKF